VLTRKYAKAYFIYYSKLLSIIGPLSRKLFKKGSDNK